MEEEFDPYTAEGVEAQWRQQCEKVRELARQCGGGRPDLSPGFDAEAEKFCSQAAPRTILELDERGGDAIDMTYKWQLRLADPLKKPKKSGG